MTTIISWNVNGIRAIHKKGFLDWLAAADPDMLCIQEIKGKPEQFPKELLEVEGYHPFWRPAKRPGYSGVMTYSKVKPHQVEVLGDDAFDDEGRVQLLYYPDYVLINTYFPNSQEKGRRIDYKIAFCDALLKRCKELENSGHNVVLCGDYNIAHKAIDLKRPEDNEENPGYLPEERAWMDKFVGEGFVDTFRMFIQEGDHYTWWSYRTRARERNIGWRIDYHCVNEGFRDQVAGCEIMSDVIGSDHCPVKLVLAT